MLRISSWRPVPVSALERTSSSTKRSSTDCGAARNRRDFPPGYPSAPPEGDRRGAPRLTSLARAKRAAPARRTKPAPAPAAPPPAHAFGRKERGLDYDSARAGPRSAFRSALIAGRAAGKRPPGPDHPHGDFARPGGPAGAAGERETPPPAGRSAENSEKLDVPPSVQRAYSGIRIRWKDSESGKEGTIDVPMGSAVPIPDTTFRCVRTCSCRRYHDERGDHVVGSSPKTRRRGSPCGQGRGSLPGWSSRGFPTCDPVHIPGSRSGWKGGPGASVTECLHGRRRGTAERRQSALSTASIRRRRSIVHNLPGMTRTSSRNRPRSPPAGPFVGGHGR